MKIYTIRISHIYRNRFPHNQTSTKNIYIRVTIFQFEDIFKQLEEEIKSIQEMIPFNFDNTLEVFVFSILAFHSL